MCQYSRRYAVHKIDLVLMLGSVPYFTFFNFVTMWSKSVWYSVRVLESRAQQLPSNRAVKADSSPQPSRHTPSNTTKAIQCIITSSYTVICIQSIQCRRVQVCNWADPPRKPCRACNCMQHVPSASAAAAPAAAAAAAAAAQLQQPNQPSGSGLTGDGQFINRDCHAVLCLC